VTLAIHTATITEERLAEIAGPVSIHVSVPPAEGLAAVAQVQRRDYSQLIIEGTRGTDGTARYFGRLDRGGSAEAAERATSFDTGLRVPLGVGGARILAVYFGDEDGDGFRDIIARLEGGGLIVFLVSEIEAGASTASRENAPSSAPDPDAASPSGASHF
jgi:hypothetical protein